VLVHSAARPDLSQDVQAWDSVLSNTYHIVVATHRLTGNLPSHLIFAFLHREQAATGRDTFSMGVSSGIRSTPSISSTAMVSAVHVQEADKENGRWRTVKSRSSERVMKRWRSLQRSPTAVPCTWRRVA